MEVWTFYNVILPAAVPVVLVWFTLWLIGKPQSIMLIVGDGQLCFFAIALLAVMIHELETIDDARKHTQWAIRHLAWALPSSLIIILLITVIFALITIEKNPADSAVKTRLTWASIVLTLATLIVIYYWRSNLELFP